MKTKHTKEEWQSVIKKRKQVTTTMIAVKWFAALLAVGAAWYFNQWPALGITMLLLYVRHLNAIIREKQIKDEALRRFFANTFDQSTASAEVE